LNPVAHPPITIAQPYQHQLQFSGVACAWQVQGLRELRIKLVHDPGLQDIPSVSFDQFSIQKAPRHQYASEISFITLAVTI
jgi:hypothetical protein